MIESGKAVDAVLGTRDNPGEGAPRYSPTPTGRNANSNSDGQWLFTDSVSANMITAAMAYHMDKF